MSKVATIKLTKAGSIAGPFTVSTEWGDVLAINVSKKSLIQGVNYTVDDRVNFIILESTGKM